MSAGLAPPRAISDLLKLAERCEAATAEQQDFIFKDVGAVIYDFGSDAQDMRRFLQLLRYNAFLDAAMTLVPEGLDPQVCKGPMFALAANEQRPWGVSLIGNARQVEGEFGPEMDYDSFDANAASAALALCAAALRARAVSPTLQSHRPSGDRN